MKKERKAALVKYFDETKEEYGISWPVSLSFVKEEPEEGYFEYPPEVVLHKGRPSSVLRRSIRHELAHAKLHADYGRAYEDAEDLVRKEIEADLLATGKPPELRYLISNIVHRFGLRKGAAFQVVRQVALDLGLPESAIAREGKAFSRTVKEFGGFRAFRKETKDW